MSGWDYWRGTLEAAQAQAQAAASQASKFAEVVSAQVSEQSRVLAAQAAQRATDLSKAAAEGTSGARAHLSGVDLSQALAGLRLPGGDGNEAQPAAEQLARFAITLDFCAFVRGLTYSTFRDFPPNELDKLVAAQQAGNGSTEDGADSGQQAALNPWQAGDFAKHAMLICLAVKEMNELRFVLVPKFLADEQFWAIYFALTRSRLPPEAFDVSLQREPAPEPAAEPQKQEKVPLFKSSDIIKPAAVVAGPAGDGGEAQDRPWLRNLVCGFDMEIPAERLQQETVVLGALQSRFHQLQESARAISIPEDLKHNISANLGNVREFVGDLVPGARGGTPGAARPSDAAEPAGTSLAPAMPPSPAAVCGNSGANGDAQAAGLTATAAGHPAAASVAARAGDGGALALEASGGAASPRPSHGGESQRLSEPPELDTDLDLEAYLKEMADSDDGGGGDNEDADSEAASLEDGEYDKYLADLSHSGGGSDAGSDAGSGEEVELDLDEYLKAVAPGDNDDGDLAAEASTAEQTEPGSDSAA